MSFSSGMYTHLICMQFTEMFLSCKPQVAEKILSEEGMSEVLQGKLLISILAGVTISQLANYVPSSTRVVRAMPNTPCKVR